MYIFVLYVFYLFIYLYIVVIEVYGRMFGVWMLLICILCFFCVLNFDNKFLYLVIFLFFMYVFGYFLTEYFIYRIMVIGNLMIVGIFVGNVVKMNVCYLFF